MGFYSFQGKGNDRRATLQLALKGLVHKITRESGEHYSIDQSIQKGKNDKMRGGCEIILQTGGQSNSIDMVSLRQVYWLYCTCACCLARVLLLYLSGA